MTYLLHLYVKTQAKQFVTTWKGLVWFSFERPGIKRYHFFKWLADILLEISRNFGVSPFRLLCTSCYADSTLLWLTSVWHSGCDFSFAMLLSGGVIWLVRCHQEVRQNFPGPLTCNSPHLAGDFHRKLQEKSCSTLCLVDFPPAFLLPRVAQCSL